MIPLFLIKLVKASFSCFLAFYFKILFLCIGFGNPMSSSTGGYKLPLQESKRKFQREASNRQVWELWFISSRHIIGNGNEVMRYQ